MISGSRAARRLPKYQFRVAAMGLVFIVASFVLMLLGAVPLGMGITAGNPALVLAGAVSFGWTTWLFVRCLRVAVIVSARGLVVRNLVHTYRLAWPQVADIRPKQVPGFARIGSDHIVLTVGVVDPSLTRIEALATRTVIADSGVRLFPLLAVLDVHADSDDITVDHCLPDGSPLPG